MQTYRDMQTELMHARRAHIQSVGAQGKCGEGGICPSWGQSACRLTKLSPLLLLHTTGFEALPWLRRHAPVGRPVFVWRTCQAIAGQIQLLHERQAAIWPLWQAAGQAAC